MIHGEGKEVITLADISPGMDIWRSLATVWCGSMWWLVRDGRSIPTARELRPGRCERELGLHLVPK
jgi:hypothetical protein